LAEKRDCDECREAHKAFDLGEPDCEECLPPLWPENVLPLEIYLKVQNQHIMGFSGPVDLNLESLFRVLDLYEVNDKKQYFDLIHRTYLHINKARIEKEKLKKDQ